ncbi:hypothetical protein RB213_008153 [Colletotrichum asianum]
MYHAYTRVCCFLHRGSGKIPFIRRDNAQILAPVPRPKL